MKAQAASTLGGETARSFGAQEAQGKESRMAKRYRTQLCRSVESWRAQRVERDTADEQGAAAGLYAAAHRAFSRLGPPPGPRKSN